MSVPDEARPSTALPPVPRRPGGARPVPGSSGTERRPGEPWPGTPAHAAWAAWTSYLDGLQDALDALAADLDHEAPPGVPPLAQQPQFPVPLTLERRTSRLGEQLAALLARMQTARASVQHELSALPRHPAGAETENTSRASTLGHAVDLTS